MANVKKGHLTAMEDVSRFTKHIRPFKRLFWKRERRAAKRDAWKEAEART